MSVGLKISNFISMIDITDEMWEDIFNMADETVQKAISELPEPVRKKANEWVCWLEKYSPRSEGNKRVLGICAQNGNGICIYVGEIFQFVQGNKEHFIKEICRVYYHELAHGIGKLNEWEVQSRGL